MFAAILRASSFVSNFAADRRPGRLRARRLRLRPSALSEVRAPLNARRHDLRVDLRQSLGGLLSLRRTCDNGLDAIHHDPSTHLGAVGNKNPPVCMLS